MRKIVVLAALVVCATSVDAAAQITQRPTRPYRGLFGGGPAPDPSRSRSEATFSGSLMVGYDTWLSPGGQPTGPTQERQSGSTVTGDAALSYFRGRTQRSVSLDARAETSGYSGIGAGPTVGGAVTVRAVTNLGRLTELRVAQDFGYEPTLVLGGLGPTDLDVDATVAPPADVTSGYLEQRSWSSNSSISLARRWTPRQTTHAGAGYSRFAYLDEFGYDTRTRLANLTHSWSFSRTSSIEALYSFTDSDLDAVDALATPLTDQNIEVSFGYNRRLSPTRQLTITAGGGATHVSTLNALDRSDLTYWMPSGSGSVSLDVGRSWSIAGHYSRGADVLQGVSLTSFATDSASASVSGLLNSRIETSLSASYSNGRSGGAGTSGRFENYSGSLQLRYAISRCCATAVIYDYYFYDFRDVVDLPSHFSSNFDRQAIRVGITIWLPLYGTYADGESSRGSRRN
jgi:hypothetical protein